MSSKRAIRRRSCDGKIRHADQREALDHIAGLNRRKGFQGSMNAYRCDFCGGWHVGHRPREKHRA